MVTKPKYTERKTVYKNKVPTHGYAVGLRPPGAPKMCPIKEALVLQHCKFFLEKQKNVFWRRLDGGAKLFNGKMAKSENCGMPDLLIISQGITFGIELKKPWSGSLSDKQAQCLCEMSANGAVAGVCCSISGLIRVLSGEEPSCYIETEHGVVPVWY